MGSLLAPTMANLFVGHLEELFLEESKIKVPFYVRYGDESLLIIKKRRNIYVSKILEFVAP